MSNNIQTIQVTGSTTASISVAGSTHAAYRQNVLVTIIGNGQSPVTHTFNGTGENVPFPNPFAQGGVNLPATVTFDFTYSANGGPYNPAPRSQPSELYSKPQLKLYSVTSEDATDNDDNDSYMVLHILKHL